MNRRLFPLLIFLFSVSAYSNCADLINEISKRAFLGSNAEQIKVIAPSIRQSIAKNGEAVFPTQEILTKQERLTLRNRIVEMLDRNDTDHLTVIRETTLSGLETRFLATSKSKPSSHEYPSLSPEDVAFVEAAIRDAEELPSFLFPGNRANRIRVGYAHFSKDRYFSKAFHRDVIYFRWMFAVTGLPTRSADQQGPEGSSLLFTRYTRHTSPEPSKVQDEDQRVTALFDYYPLSDELGISTENWKNFLNE